MNVLIVEDEDALRESIYDYLSSQDFSCQTAGTFAQAADAIESQEFDCIILDISLPGGSGLTLLERLKAEAKHDGVIIISAKNSLDDKITGLTLGADDYLTKPFHLSELSARMSAIIRRRRFSGNNVLSFGPLKIDTREQSVTVNAQDIFLTRKEYDLLLYFVSNRKRVISKEAIARHLWGDELGSNYDFIYTHIKNLRKKLIDAGSIDLIQSVYGFGYKFSEE